MFWPARYNLSALLMPVPVGSSVDPGLQNVHKQWGPAVWSPQSSGCLERMAVLALLMARTTCNPSPHVK